MDDRCAFDRTGDRKGGRTCHDITLLHVPVMYAVDPISSQSVCMTDGFRELSR